ncbi:hypothetical protein BV898_16038 [Hypsibius exemplaris]|uniref:Bulb-type lectin domain-containing protein n=1 Tax=Hypsibius exemplaris TaxID=2072580 RepID=A0A9X6RL41_HYPEX|nr:hypothetical protein BV898_16038 [Hypsibius exemplaris]
MYRCADSDHAPWRVASGASLSVGEVLWSAKRTVKLEMQPTGRLVLHRLCDGRTVWQSQTEVYKEGPPRHALMQTDGNLVVYSVDGRVIWSSRTNDSRFAGAILKVLDEGFVCLEKDAECLWKSGSEASSCGSSSVEPEDMRTTAATTNLSTQQTPAATANLSTQQTPAATTNLSTQQTRFQAFAWRVATTTFSGQLQRPTASVIGKNNTGTPSGRSAGRKGGMAAARSGRKNRFCELYTRVFESVFKKSPSHPCYSATAAPIVVATTEFSRKNGLNNFTRLN